MSYNGAIARIDFHGDTVLAQEQADGPPLVAVKPIVERLGLAWNGQFERIKRDAVLAEGIRMIRMPTPGGPQDSVALPLNLIPGFLFGIDDSRVSPEVRPLVLAYKCECHDVLYRHFFGARAVPPDPTAGWDWQAIGAKLQMVREARLQLGRKVSSQLWAELGLPLPDDPGLAPRSPATQGLDFVKHFLDDCTVEDPAGQVQARHLSEAYARWAGQNAAPAMTERAFAMCLDALGVGKRAGRLVHYTGIRLKHISEQLG